MVALKNIEDFLINKEIAVIGASTNKKKFGNIIMRSLKEKGFDVFPVNPSADEIEGVKCFPDTHNLPGSVKAAILVIKPEGTIKIIENICKEKNISNVWFQQGSENSKAILVAKQNNLNIIQNECILMFIKPSVFPHSIHRFFKKIFGKYPK